MSGLPAIAAAAGAIGLAFFFARQGDVTGRRCRGAWACVILQALVACCRLPFTSFLSFSGCKAYIGLKGLIWFGKQHGLEVLADFHSSSEVEKSGPLTLRIRVWDVG